MSILVVRHISFEHLGHIAPILASRNRTLRYVNLAEPLTLHDTSALILMGGPMSANDPDPWVAAELRAIETAMRRSIPVLGICLGAQLIAKALGASVYRNPAPEIGWFPIRPQPDAAQDTLFHGFLQPETVFHWHGETFDLPAGARWLASSERCRHQAFGYGANVYGLQFHPEVTPAMIVDWLVQDANCGDVRELDTAVDPHPHNQLPFAEMIFGGWADTLLKP